MIQYSVFSDVTAAYLCPKWILSDFSSILIQTFPIVLALQYGLSSHMSENTLYVL